VSKFTLEGFAPKDAALKTEFFCICCFSKMGRRSAEQLCNDAFHVRASQSAKDWLDPAKNRGRPGIVRKPFSHESLQLLYVIPRLG